MLNGIVRCKYFRDRLFGVVCTETRASVMYHHPYNITVNGKINNVFPKKVYYGMSTRFVATRYCCVHPTMPLWKNAIALLLLWFYFLHQRRTAMGRRYLKRQYPENSANKEGPRVFWGNPQPMKPRYANAPIAFTKSSNVECTKGPQDKFSSQYNVLSPCSS